LEKVGLALEELRTEQGIEKRKRKRKREKYVYKGNWKLHLGWLLKDYVRPFLGALILTLIFMMLASFFSAGRVAFLKPVIEVLFLESGADGEVVLDQSDTFGKVMAPVYRIILEQADKGPFRVLYSISVFIVIVCCLKGICAFGHDYLMRYVTEGIMCHFRESVYGHIIELPLSHFSGSGTGKLMSYVNNDVVLVKQIIAVVFERVILQPMHVVAYLVLALLLNWRLTLVSLLVVPVSAVVIAIVGKKVRRAKEKSQIKLSDLNAILHETFSGIRIVRAFRMEEYEKGRYGKKAKDIFRLAKKMARVRAAASPVVEMLGGVGLAGVLLLGGYLILVRNTMDGSSFLTYIAILGLMYAPLKRLGKANAELQQGLVGLSRLYDIIHQEIPIKDSEDSIVLPAFQNEIAFEDVCFSYNRGEEQVISDVSFKVRKGETVALVGHSGGGKSTLMDLLLRFYDVNGGRISIDGHDIRDVTLKSLRDQMGVVPQDVILFNDTVRNNIAYGRQEAPDEKLHWAAKQANAHDFIMSFPDGYDTEVGERGAQLSGGQAQRISIARALFKDPALLIFDEATSSLDSEAELLIRNAITNLIQNRTTLIIAHRLSTILHADQILVLDKGRVVGAGKHEELVESNDIYKRLYELQFRNSEQDTQK